MCVKELAFPVQRMMSLPGGTYSLHTCYQTVDRASAPRLACLRAVCLCLGSQMSNQVGQVASHRVAFVLNGEWQL